MASVTARLASTDGSQDKGTPYFQSAAPLDFTLGEPNLTSNYIPLLVRIDEGNLSRRHIISDREPTHLGSMHVFDLDPC